MTFLEYTEGKLLKKRLFIIKIKTSFKRDRFGLQGFDFVPCSIGKQSIFWNKSKSEEDIDCSTLRNITFCKSCEQLFNYQEVHSPAKIRFSTSY